MIAMLVFCSMYCLKKIAEALEEDDYTTLRVYLIALVLSVASVVGEIK